MSGRRAEHLAVRLGIPALLVASCAGAAAVSWHATKSQIPPVALGSHVVLAVQIALLFFYGALLLLVPLVRALVDGDLPVELSLRGARWKESLFGFGDKFLVRQGEAEEEALRANAERKEEIRLLRQELKAGDLASEELADQAIKRVAAIEEKVRRQGCRS
jgi:hypothetical protein